MVQSAPQGGHNAVLEGVHMTLGNKHTYTIFIDNGLIHNKWGTQIFSLSMGAL